MSFVKILCIAGSIFAATHCGNTGIYDEATTNYVRIVRSGLNEWYPLNGNLSSKIGSAAGTATGSYSAGANRAGESGKAVCLTSSPAVLLDFGTSTSVGTAPFTIAVWMKLDVLPGVPKSILQKGSQSTAWYGFKIEANAATSFPLTFGNGPGSDQTLTLNSPAAGVWYYFVFSYGNGVGSFYAGKYGGSLVTVASMAGSYLPDPTPRPLQIFTAALDGCADDMVHYNRVLSFDEVKQNFLSVE